MQTVTDGITVAELARLAEGRFGGLVKADLLERGSRQADLWGVNLYPDRFGTPDFIEPDSMINIRPSQGNRTRSVDDPAARSAVEAVVARLVRP